MTFRGGTSLSKGYNLIRRFSEDVDIVLSVPGLFDRDTKNPFRKHVSKTKFPGVMATVMKRAEEYVHGVLHDEIAAHFAPLGCRIEKNASDTATIALTLHYPIMAGEEASISTGVLLQFCVRADLEPHSPIRIAPYVQQHLRGAWDLAAPAIRTLRPSRTFIEKLFAMHTAAAKFERDRGNVADKNRLSRHYYDVAMMQDTVFAKRALAGNMLAKVRKNQEIRWEQKGWVLETAKPGTLKILPPDGLMGPLQRDYVGMQAMMFDNPPPPTFDEVIEKLTQLDHYVNRTLFDQ